MRKTVRKNKKNFTKGGMRDKKMNGSRKEDSLTNLFENKDIMMQLSKKGDLKKLFQNKDKLKGLNKDGSKLLKMFEGKMQNFNKNKNGPGYKASYNKNSESYVCNPTNFELILPPTHKSSSTVVGQKNMTYYKINVPKDTKPGSRIRFKQPTPSIKNVDHNAGKNPPNCPGKQRLRSVTPEEIAAYKSHKSPGKRTTVNNRKNYDKNSSTTKAFEVADRVTFASDQILGTDLYQYTPGALWFSGVKKLAGI